MIHLSKKGSSLLITENKSYAGVAKTYDQNEPFVNHKIFILV